MDTVIIVKLETEDLLSIIKVQRLMKLMGLAARIVQLRVNTRLTRERLGKADNLNSTQFEGAKPYEKCYTDVTEFALPIIEKPIYPPVLDGYNSEIIEFTLSRSPDLKQVQTMLKERYGYLLQRE